MDKQQYIDELIEIDIDIAGKQEQYNQLESEQLIVEKDYNKEISNLVQTLEDLKCQLFTPETQKSENEITEYQQEYFQSHFSILSNIKVSLQIIEARQSNLSLQENIQKLIMKNQFLDAIKLLSNTFKASHVLGTKFIEQQQTTLDILNNFIENQELSLIFPSCTPQFIYYQAQKPDFHDIINYYFLFIDQEQPPTQLTQLVKFLSDIMQAIINQLELLFTILIQLFENQYYHILTQMFHNKYIFVLFESEGVNLIFQKVIDLFSRIAKLLESSNDQPEIKPNIALTATNLLLRFRKILGSLSGKFQIALNNVDKAFLKQIYDQEISQVIMVDFTGFQSSFQNYILILQQALKDYFSENLILKTEFQGAQIYQNIQFSLKQIEQIESEEIDKKSLQADFLAFVKAELVLVLSQLDLQSVYYLQHNLATIFPELDTQFQAKVSVFLSKFVSTALSTLKSSIFTAATTFDYTDLISDLSISFNSTNGPFDGQAHAPWATKFASQLLKQVQKSIFDVGKSTKIQNFQSASAQINEFQRFCTQILHMSGASYVQTLRQWLQVAGCVSWQEVQMIKEECGNAWIESGDDEVVFRANFN